jgi:hypothetical protein
MSPSIRKFITVTPLLTAAIVGPLFAHMLFAGDLSSYREFRLGMNLQTVEKQTEAKAYEVKMIHERPAVMQDIEWRPRDFSRFAESDPVKDVLLSFYNGQLFRMVVNYDRYRTEGMTAADMIDAISTAYGVAANPNAEILFPSAASENVKVIARWEDDQYSLNLVRSPYQPSFALVSLSKQLNGLAQAAVVESIRLDRQEAPQREAERNRRQADEVSAKQEKARMVNKPSFRP